MNKLKIIFLLFLNIALQSCNKQKDFDALYNNEKTDTIFPKALFPVYPGSWWRYINQKGDTIKIETSASYVLNTLTYATSDWQQYQAHPKYVPLWNGNPVYGYYVKWDNFINGDKYPHAEFNPIVSDKLGDLYQTNEKSGVLYSGSKISGIVVNLNTTILVNNLIYNGAVKVEEDCSSYKRTSYFVPDIGLVSQEVILSYDSTKYKKIELIDYHINH